MLTTTSLVLNNRAQKFKITCVEMYVNVGIDRAQVQTIFSDMRYFDISVFEMARVIVAASIREDGKSWRFPSQIIKGSYFVKLMSNINIANAFSVFITFPGAGPRSAVGSASDSRVSSPGFDTWSGLILSFLLPLIQEGQLSATGESMCTKYWLTA